MAGASSDLGFTYRVLKGGDVEIAHHGQRAVTLRADAAARFVAKMQRLGQDAQQQQMARLTGNYRRGNERSARSHPRNR